MSQWCTVLLTVERPSSSALEFCAVQVGVTDEEVVKAKEFALAEIVKLSDSYRDMKITKVISAETARSVLFFASCARVRTRYFLAVSAGAEFSLPLLLFLLSISALSLACSFLPTHIWTCMHTYQVYFRYIYNLHTRVYMCVCVCVRMCVCVCVCVFVCV